LIGFANADLPEAAALWDKRVHVDDRATLSSSWIALRKGTPQSICDYRFFPKHSKTAIRLLEVSVLIPGLQLVVSVYFTIADPSEEPKDKETERVLQTLLHDIQNHLHVVTMEIELSELGLQRSIEVARLAKRLSSVAQLPQDLRDYLDINAMNMTIEDLESVLKSIIRRIQCQLHRQKANLRVVRPESIPPVEVDMNQTCAALERVVETSAESIGIDVSDSSRCSAGIWGNQVEMALDLAREILRQYHGQETFGEEKARKGK
jgi:signal transduction histidine kinase